MGLAFNLSIFFMVSMPFTILGVLGTKLVRMSRQAADERNRVRPLDNGAES